MTQVAVPHPHIAPPRNGFGITALVLALIGLVFALIPLTGFLALVLGVLAVVFGLLGVARTRKGRATNKVMSWIGTALGALSLALGVWGMVVVFQATEQLVRDMEQIGADLRAPGLPTPRAAVPVIGSGTAQGTVRYEVEGSGTALSITYSTMNGGGFSSEALNDVAVPWSAEVPVNTEGFTSYSLTASTDEDGGTLTCRIRVDGQVVQEATSSGPYQTAMCMK